MFVIQDVSSLGQHAMNIVELIQLGKIERGSLLPYGKYKKLQGSWFGTKKTQSKKVDDDASEEGSTETTSRYV